MMRQALAATSLLVLALLGCKGKVGASVCPEASRLVATSEVGGETTRVEVSSVAVARVTENSPDHFMLVVVSNAPAAPGALPASAKPNVLLSLTSATPFAAGEYPTRMDERPNSAPTFDAGKGTIRVTLGSEVSGGVTLTAVEDTRVCGKVDVKDKYTSIQGEFVATRTK